MNTVDVMVDLETLGTTPGSVVLSIGAVANDPGRGQNAFLTKIDIRDSLHAGLTVDPDTMSWWRKQDREAWLSSTNASTSNSDGAIREGLTQFAYWLAALRAGPDTAATGAALRIWGDASSFDLTLLACVYRAVSLPVPWNYTEEFDYRTLRTLMDSKKPRSKLQHDGLSDAIAQMSHLQELLATLTKAGAIS